MNDPMSLQDFLELLEAEPHVECYVREEVAKHFDFDLQRAADIAGRKLIVGVEFTPGQAGRPKLYTFCRKGEV